MRFEFRKPPGGEVRGDAPSRSPRIQEKAAELSARLKHCTKRELEMLIRYYVNGQDEQTVLSHMGATREEFACLRGKLRKSVMPERPVTPPKARSAMA